ncbi:MAG: nucleoside-diphosphate-sugar epimerase [Kiritimatiellia bacterium]|jgi:nucleoside-diphosphate-sugar epimerase
MGNATKATVLIAGCGYVGIPLAEKLTRAGHTVYGLRRDPSTLPEAIIPVAADLTKPLPADLIPEPLDAVFYTASATGKREPSVYRSIYVDGPTQVQTWLQAHHPACRRFIFTSSTSVYGQTDGSWIDEDAPTENPTFSGSLMREGEVRVLASALPSIVVRFSGIYGPGRHRLIHQVAEGQAWVPEEPRYLNHLHQEDCAGVLAHLMQLEHPKSLYLASDHEPADRADVLTWIAGELGVPLVSGAEPMRRSDSNKRCRNDRLLASGYMFIHPTFREGYAREIARYVGK